MTAIMPTRDRRSFVENALRCFAHQDYPNSELIVVDDGDDPVADLVPAGDPRINYLRPDGARSIGAKRNLACERATGEIIAHWDDDDWSAPSRLREQVSAILRTGSDLCGLAQVLHYRPLRGDAWRPGPSVVSGASLVYRREAWLTTGFDDINRGEDSSFLGRFPADRRLILPGAGLMIVIEHGQNVSGRSIGAPSWQPVPLDEIGALLGDDRAFYTGLRSGSMAPALPRTGTGTGITVAASFDVFSGYGGTAGYLALSLARSGALVSAVPLGEAPDGLSPELLNMIDRPEATDDQPTVYHSWLRPDIQRFFDNHELFVSTMWEADRLPPSWIPPLQRARAVIVPSTFVARTCRASGVNQPVVVVPLGVDPDVYYDRPRPDRPAPVTLIVAPVDDRKHTRLGIAAWKAAFLNDPDARLVIKTTYGYHNYVPDDPRITYVDRIEPGRGIAGYYHNADVLLAIGNEGFGLPLVEGMASGLPVVALDAEGQHDVCREAGDLVLAVPATGLEPHAHHVVGAAGRRSVPDFEAVVRQLRWVADHPGEARNLGREASEWVVENRNIWSLGPGVLDAVDRTSLRSRSPVRARTMWIPTLGNACGIAETTARLLRNLPSVRRRAEEPDPTGPGTVHVQHEPSIIDELRLEGFAARASRGRTAVVVTEHSVFDHPAAWERVVDALVTTTQAGAGRLRRRYPHKRVEVIPLGCETWNMPRKSARGRTIGFFGFPGRHKRLDLLAAAARTLPRCEVLLYAHHTGRIPPAIADWPPDLPLRWERGWLPTPQIAARLAAETDVLVFPYDEVAHCSASSAALLALSTGVPVLTSDTTWFADLGPAVQRATPGVEALAQSLDRLLNDDELRNRTTDAARAHCDANSWSRVAARHVDLWNSIETA